MYLARKYQLGTLFLRLLLETGSPFYLVTLATRRSSRLQCKGSTFISQLFKDPEYWSGPRNRTAVTRSTDWANSAAVRLVKEHKHESSPSQLTSSGCGRGGWFIVLMIVGLWPQHMYIKNRYVKSNLLTKRRLSGFFCDTTTIAGGDLIRAQFFWIWRLDSHSKFIALKMHWYS